jgi:hypothetical protein
VAQLDPDLPIADVSPMSEILADSMDRTTFTMMMIVLATGIAILLARAPIQPFWLAGRPSRWR